MLSMDKIIRWFSILPLSPAGFLAMQRTRRRTAPTLKTQMSRSSATCVVIGKTCWIPVEKTLASYFGRLLSYIVKGEFVDEDGVKHTGGPAYSRFNRKKRSCLGVVQRGRT